MRSASRSRPSIGRSWRRWRTSCSRPRTRTCRLAKKIQGKPEPVEKIDNGLQKGSKKKVEPGPKIEELREEQDTHRSSTDDQNKDLYELKKKKAKLQGERKDKDQNASSERIRREEVTKAHLKGPKKNLTEPEGSSGSSGLYGSSGSSVKKRKKKQADMESGCLKEREVQKNRGFRPAHFWMATGQLPLQASPGSPRSLSRPLQGIRYGSSRSFRHA